MIVRALTAAALLFLLPPRQAREIEIYSDNPVAVQIEWITIARDGTTTVTARRMTAIGPAVPLSFTHEEGRAVRFSYPGASPRTYTTRELAAVRRLRLPDPAPGGEVIFVVPQAAVRPVTLDLEGPSPRTVKVDDGVLAVAAGLRPGPYAVAPIYEGGMRGTAHTVDVIASRSSAHRVPAEAVGAARLTMSASVCVAITRIEIRTLRRQSSGRAAAPVVEKRSPECRVTFGGLPPGEYEAAAGGAAGGLGTAAFTVRPQAVSDVAVDPSNVVITGTVTRNGQPLAGAILQVHPIMTAGAATPVGVQERIVTGSDGRFLASLERPGRFRCAVAHDGWHLTFHHFEAWGGTTVVDIPILGGTLTVIAESWDMSRNLDVTVRGQGLARSDLWHPSLGPKRQVGGNLLFGKYQVSMKYATDAFPAGEMKEVEISAVNPRVEVRLNPGRTWPKR